MIGVSSMNMIELKEQFDNGLIEKHEYVKSMFESHQILEQYSRLLVDNSIDSINISKDGIVFTIKGNHDLKLYHLFHDMYEIPLHYLNFGEYEEEEYKLMMSLIDEGDTILDIGANVGWYALNILKSFKNIQVHSFEPLPQNYEYLLKNFKINNVSSSQAYNMGLYKENTILEFYFDTENSMASSLTNLRGLECTKKINCTAKRLDDFLEEKKITRVDFIKCDVEGAELFVYQGATRTLKEQKPIVFSEMLRKWSAKFNYHPNDIISLFNEIEYLCFAINNGTLQLIGKVDENTKATNYLFLHKQKHKKLIEKI